MFGYAWALAIIAIVLPGCGSAGRAPFEVAPQDESSVTAIDIGLPDRTPLRNQVSDIETKMNGYRLTVVSTGSGCTNVNETKDYGARTINAVLKQGCDYDVTLALGNLSQSGGSSPAPEKVTYEGMIKSLIDSKCISCHATGRSSPDLSGFANAKASGDQMLSAILAGRMPRGNTMTQAERDAFQAWKNGGFAERADAVQPAPSGTSLGTIYYANSSPVRITRDQIQGRSQLAVSVRVQLQDAGRAIGLGGDTGEDNTGGDNDNNGGQPTPTEPNLPANKNFELTGNSGATKLASIFKGEYMLLDFSASNCTFCRDRASELNTRDTDLHALLSGTKCSHATIVPRGDLADWQRVAGGAQSFVGKHSYSGATGRIGDLLSTIVGSNPGTPTFVFIDREGKMVGSYGHSIPRAQIEQLCR